MQSRLLALVATGLMAASGCSTTPLMPQMDSLPKTQLPTECLASCQPLPRVDSGDEIAVVIWAHNLIEVAGQCRRMHDTCRKAKE